MNNTLENIREILQAKIAEHIGAPFTLTSYTEQAEPDLRYKVNGVMTRYGEPANVEAIVKKDGFIPAYWSITDEKITMNSQYIGNIILGKDVSVSDPCYKRDVWCRTTLNNVKPGVWEIYASVDTIDSWGKRVYVLELMHRDVKQNEPPDWVNHFSLGVDSGTMSVIDDAYYRRKNGSADDFEADEVFAEQFLNKCYDLTDNNSHIGIYKSGNKSVGVVCSSGIGDGEYPLDIVEQNGEITAMKINFM